jgi:hypothetical protein
MMEIKKENINGKEETRIIVSFEDVVTKQKLTWKFKSFKFGEFRKEKIVKIEEDISTVGIRLVPLQMMINSMMVEGEKITDNTDMYIVNGLKRELAPFLT